MNRSPHSQLTDAELLRLFYAGQDNQWLGLLLDRYTLLLYGVCMKYLKNQDLARDAVQQIFLKVITELPKYEVRYFGSWLYMIARNHCLMLLRNKRNSARPVDTLEDSLEAATDSDFIVRENQLQQLESALQHLNPEQKRCVSLFYLHKKSYQEIAAETGFSLLQVKSHIQNGKRNLRLLIERQAGER